MKLLASRHGGRWMITRVYEFNPGKKITRNDLIQAMIRINVREEFHNLIKLEELYDEIIEFEKHEKLHVRSIIVAKKDWPYIKSCMK